MKSFSVFSIDSLDAQFMHCTYICISQENDDDWEGVNLDDDDNFDDDELDISDDDFYKKPSGIQRQKRVRNGSKSSRESKPSTSFSRRKRGRTSFDYSDTSPYESDDDIEDDFKSTRRRSSNLRKDTGGRSIPTKGSGRSNEVRTSTRSVRKVSYVESEDSEEHDVDIKKKGSKVEFIHKCTFKLFKYSYQ